MNDEYSRFTRPPTPAQQPPAQKPAATETPKPAAAPAPQATTMPAAKSTDEELLAAIKSGAESAVRSLLKNGANANAVEEKTSLSALTLAINKGSPPEVEALIAAGANVNEKDAKNRTRLEHAIDKYTVAKFTRTTIADKHAAPYAKKIATILASALPLNLGAKTSAGTDHASYARKAGLTEIADALAAKTTKAQSGVGTRTDTVE